MKIVTLMENTACRADLAAEHGLSLYIETGDRKLLFDAGQSGGFADNARKLGVDLSRVDTAVLSHGHYDHGGGLKRFLEINQTAPVYVSAHAFGQHYHGAEKYIGLDQQLLDDPRLLPVSKPQPLGPGITLFPGDGCPAFSPIRPFGLTVRENGVFRPEEFLHEQYLLVEEQGKRILFSGCSHRGIGNILRWFPCDVLIGGFHFVKLDPAGEALREALEALKALPTVYYTGHCTGQAQFDAMKEILGERLHALSTGSRFEL